MDNSLFDAKGNSGPPLVPLDASLFYYSELSVTDWRCMQAGFPKYLWGLPFYHTSKIMFVLSTASGGDKD
jgi:hypothetical protein